MNFNHIFQPVPARDWVIITLLFSGISLFIVISELIRKHFHWSEEFTRKFVHISVGLLMFFAPILLETSLPMVLIAAFFTLVNFVALRKGMLKAMHGQRHSYGTVFYPLAFLILVLFAWPQYKVLIIAPVMLLALGDAIAAIVGESLSHPHTYVLISEKKSLEGSLAMFLSGTVILFLILQFYPFESPFPVSGAWIALWLSVLTAVLATAAEALSSKGNDNLSVPLFSAIILYYLLTRSTGENLQLTLGTVLGGLTAILSYRWKFLSASGAVATFLLASVVFGFGGWAWTIPILTFFILSSLLSKVGKGIKQQFDLIFEKGHQRDYAQVLANGGLAGVLMIVFMFNKNPAIYLYYLAALAAATADTWATEIGVYVRQRPRLILNLQPVPAGTSGGITVAGLFGALVGAAVIAVSGYSFLDARLSLSAIPFLLMISGSGFLGSVVDSYLGATVQIQYQCSICGKITEKKIHCEGKETLPLFGIRWINNDVVNFLNTLSALIFVHLGLSLIF